MQNQDEGRPRYTSPDHPYSGSDGRYQNQYSSGEYHQGDKPFQFPWWAILIPFCVGMWPVSVVFIVLNQLIKNGKLGGFEQKARTAGEKFTQSGAKPVYEATFRRVSNDAKIDSTPVYDRAPASAAEKKLKHAGLATGLTVAGVLLLVVALVALPDAIFWLPDALTEGGYYWRWMLEDSMPAIIGLCGGLGCLYGGHRLRTSSRMRKKIMNIVGDAKYMYIEDIAAAVPCSYDKCCKHLENCIDAGVFGSAAYLDMRRRCLVVSGKAPEQPTPAPAPAPAPAAAKAEPAKTQDEYQKILDELRRVNDAIPDEEMTDKISRLEAVSAKIFEQAKADPDKLPRMRKFMDYYLPTSLKLLQAYAELDAQGVEGENITESKRRIEQTMDTLVHAFETQLDQLFAADAMDISTDIDVMERMMKADGLTDEPTPFQK